MMYRIDGVCGEVLPCGPIHQDYRAKSATSPAMAHYFPISLNGRSKIAYSFQSL